MIYIYIGVSALVVLVLAVLLGGKKKQQKGEGLQVGDTAPDFELKNYQGKSFRLSSYRGKQPVVVFFYPADNTPGCTAEVSRTRVTNSTQ